VTAEVFLFWFLAIVTVVSALGVLFMPNPIYSAFSLIMTMIGVSALFALLGAYFLAGVQVIVYAGAVLVLFVMVMMLFDLKSEIKAFTKGTLGGVFKIGSVAVLAGLILSAIMVTTQGVAINFQSQADYGMQPTRLLGNKLFTQYVIIFEILGALLLVVAVGAVALSRSKGGTHARRID